MASKIFPFQTNFTGGELSPRLFARADLGKYQHGVKLMENFIPTPQGGAFTRPGLALVDDLSFSLGSQLGEISQDNDPPRSPIRLVPFEFNASQAYILAFVPFGGGSAGKIFIYTNSLPLETSPGSQVRLFVTHTYTEAQLFELEFAQSADILEITHKDHPIRQLRRLGATQWVLVDKPLTGQPMGTRTKKPSMDLTLSASVGANQTATTSSPYWLAGDVGRSIEGSTPTTGNLGRATIIAITSPTVAQIDITQSFSGDLSYASGEWAVIGNGAGLIKPQMGKKQTTAYNGQLGWSANTDIWKSEDIGDHLTGWGGAMRIDFIDSSRVFRGDILDTIYFKGAGAAASFFSPLWQSGGFPSCVCYFQGRLYVAATVQYPQRIWGSEVGFYDNFRHYINSPQQLPMNANSPVNFTISDTNFIRWIIGTKVIFIGGAGGIYMMSGGSLRDPIKHDNIQVVRESSWGVEKVSPILLDDTVAYVQRGGRKIRNIVYSQDKDGFMSNDLMLMADHLGAESKIKQLSFAQSFTEKYNVPVLFAVREDGVMLALTYQPDQEVVAWSRITIRRLDQTTSLGPAGEILEPGAEPWMPPHTLPNGAIGNHINTPTFWKDRITSVATIPHPSGRGTQTWVCCRRHRVGVAVSYTIEYFDDTISTDACLTYNGVKDGPGHSILFPAATGTNLLVSVVGSPPTPSIFTAQDVGRAIKLVPEKFLGARGSSIIEPDPASALAIITSFIDTKNVRVDVVQGSFTSLLYNSGEWGIADKGIDAANHGDFFARDAFNGLYCGAFDLIGDGIVYPRRFLFFPMTQFEGGKYPYALRIQAGEGYRKRIEMVRPAQQLAAGNSLFLVKGYNRVYALISNTVGLTINGETVYFREMGNNMDMPIPTKSAIVEVTNLGHDRDANIVIEQPVSLPAVVLGVMGSLEVGEE